jgi:hypothetical protein
MHGLEIVETWTFPKTTSVTSQPAVKLLAAIASLFLKEDLPGDILCLLIRKKPQSCDS